MDRHVTEFFSCSRLNGDGPEGRFHDVICLNDKPDFAWKEVLAKMPDFPRGWFELSHLTAADRIEFTEEYWVSKIPFRLHTNQQFSRFFKALDDIGIFLTQQKFDDPYEATLVYSLKGNSGFYRGALPATYHQCKELQSQFPEHIFADDYFAFLQIHNGFRKTTDTTGIIPAEEMFEVYERFQKMLQAHDIITTKKGRAVNPKSLIPFYESFGMPFFQCFWEEWRTDQGAGNVYYSVTGKVTSDPEDGESGADTMAFPTFTDWLLFYLERIDE